MQQSSSCSSSSSSSCSDRRILIQRSTIQGFGLFAADEFAAGQRIVEYVGELISKSESIRRCSEGNHFIFYWNEDFDIDGSSESNLARFINHSCAPNCVVERVEGHLWVIAARPIASGEELTFNYGYDLVDYREHPCSCGEPDCVGYILAQEFHESVRPYKALRLA
jgi:SET domain-containing protein